MSYCTWKDYYMDIQTSGFLKNAALDITNFLDQNEPEDRIKGAVENNNIAALAIDPITNELTMNHHITRIGRPMKKTAKHTEKIVALHGLDNKALPIRFKSSKIFLINHS